MGRYRIRPTGNDAVVGMPLKLIISMLVVAITIPIAYMWLDNYAQNETEADARNAVNDIFLVSRQVYLNGPGNRRSVTIDLDGTMGKEVTGLKIGDSLPNGTDRFRAYFKITGSSRQIMVIEPNIPLTSPSNDPLELGGGRYTIVAECKEMLFGGENIMYVELSIGG